MRESVRPGTFGQHTNGLARGFSPAWKRAPGLRSWQKLDARGSTEAVIIK
jgi:hypothetical protein